MQTSIRTLSDQLFLLADPFENRGQFGGVVPEALRRVCGTAMEMEVAVRVSRNASVHLRHFCAQHLSVEVNGTSNCHARPPEGQASPAARDRPGRVRRLKNTSMPSL